MAVAATVAIAVDTVATNTRSSSNLKGTPGDTPGGFFFFGIPVDRTSACSIRPSPGFIPSALMPIQADRSFARFMPERFHRLALSVLIALLALGTSAQRPGGMGQRMASVRVYGRVLDAATKKGGEFATVSLLAMAKDSTVSGALADEHGDFSMERVPAGRFRLRIASLGYTTYEQQVTILADRSEQDLGNLLLEPGATTLKPAEVVAERSQTQLLVDRRVYNVDKDLSVRGGTGIDVMKNVPGLSVDADDNVQLRNGSPQIMVDGRPTQMTLEQIPAAEIERVEVITNPGVAFDASSGAGIINVVLKKSTRPGYYGQVQANAGTSGRYGGSANLNVKDGRWAWTLSGNTGVADNRTKSITSRDTYGEGALQSAFRQSGASRNSRGNYGGRLSADVKVSNRSTLTLGGNARGRAYDNGDDLDWTERDAAGALTRSGGQLNTGHNASSDLSVQGGFKHKTPVEGREWSTDLTWNRSRRDNSMDLATTTLGSGGEPLSGGARTQKSTGSTDGDQFTWQFDMSDPRNERNKLDYGLRSNTRIEHSILDVITGNDTMPAATDADLSKDYRITDIVNAAYVNWTRKLNDKWGLQAGLRFEQTWFQADVRGPGGTGTQSFIYRYPNGTDDLSKALFPALYFSRKWEGSREFQINISRKINRPNFFQMMPFIMFSDSRNVRLGNPALAPEFITVAEVNHLLPFKSNPRSNWLTSVFARHTDNVITSYAYPLPENNTILVNSWINGKDSWTWGWENTVKLELSKAAQLTLGGTAQYVEIGAGTLRNSGWMANAKANFNMRLPKDWSVQLNGEYEGKRPQPQGFSIPNGGIDLSAAKDFGQHWSALFMVNDVFYTRLWGTILDTPALYQETQRRREVRFVRVSLTWKFGEQDASLFRRKNQKEQKRDPGAESGGGDF